MVNDPTTPTSEPDGSTPVTAGTTRRRFLQGVGVTAGALALGGAAEAGRA